MNQTPTPSHRNVTLDIETVTANLDDPKGALSALTGRVICICLLVDDGTRITEYSLAGTCEAHLLGDFWDLIRPNDVFIGHNVLDFDLAFLRQRSFINRVQPTRDIDMRRFYSHDVIDTMHLWSNWGATPKPSLDSLAHALELGGKTAKGSTVAEWWAEGNLDSIVEYCRADVRLTFEVFLRLTYQPLPARYFSSTLIAQELLNSEIVVRYVD